MNELLNEETFLLYCARSYDGGFLATTEDFQDDLNRIKYIKKLITRYQQNGNLKERLILNHIIVLNNVFGAEPTARILYLKLTEDFNIIKPFLVTIGIMPDTFINVGQLGIINTDMIPMDQHIVERLREL
jgi:hypothetical protein